MQDNLEQTKQFFKDQAKEAGIPMDEESFKQKFEAMADDNNLDIRNESSFSPFWKFLRAVAIAPAMWLVNFVVREVMPNMFVKTAIGMFLDLLGWMYGIDRKQATKLKGLIKFSRDSIGSTLEIAAGTWIQTARINGVVYRVRVTESTSFGANDYHVSVPVEAESTGAAYNLANGYFIVLPVPITGVSSVTNEDGWITFPGADEELDDDYRLRIRGSFTTVSDHHVNSVYKSIIAAQTGFKHDRIFIDHTQAPRGAGSSDAYVLFDAEVPSQQYLDKVNSYIRDAGHHGHGDDIQVKAFPEENHNLNGTLWVAKGTPQEEKNRVQQKAEQVIRCVFRENLEFNVEQTQPFSRFSFSQLSDDIKKYLPNTKSIQWQQDDFIVQRAIARLGTLSLEVREVSQ